MLTKVQALLTHTTESVANLSAIELGPWVVLALFALLFALEVGCGHRQEPRKTTRNSYLSNLGTFLLNDTLMSLMSVSSLLLLAQHYRCFGVLRFVPDSGLQSLLCFILFDLVLYLWHRANHQFDSLWRFHKVHHSDISMNVTTAFRLHFVEVVLTTVVKALFVIVMGIEAKVLLANEALITLMVMFHHANLSFKGEQWLGKLIIVPALHRLHHSVLRQEHDSNYGAAFSLWDRLFGTLQEKEPQAIGLTGIPQLSVWQLLRYGLVWEWKPEPLQVQTRPRTETVNPQLLQKMIEEAAYYIAEKRGFKPGNDQQDWLEAERQIRNKMRA